MCDLPKDIRKFRGLKFKQIHYSFHKKINNEMQDMGITYSQLDIIRFLSFNKDKTITQKDIEQGMKLKNPTVTGLINRMEKKELVTRKIDESNKKFRIIELTSKSEKLTDVIKENIDRNERLIVKDLSSEEIAMLDYLLEKVLRNLEVGKEE